MNRAETQTKAHAMLHKHGGRRIWQADAKAAGVVEGWNVGGDVLIVQFFRNGGCTHYLPTPTTTWPDFEADVKKMRGPVAS